MPPKDKDAQAVWPKGTNVQAAHKARAAAVKAKQASYMIEYKTEGGKQTQKEIWLATGKMPTFMERGIEKSDKARAAQRPSRQARGLGHKSVRDCPDLQPAGFDGNDDDWGGTDAMPDEAREEDVG